MNVIEYDQKLPSLEGKRYLVTGSTSGLGFECVRHLLRLKAAVILASRNADKLEKAKTALLSEFPGGDIETKILDQADRCSVDFFVGSMDGERLDGIVYNAGIYFPSAGHKGLTFRTNALGTYLVFGGLKNLYPAARHVFVGSIMAMRPSRKGFAHSLEKAGRQKEYGLSKEAVELVYEQALEEGIDAVYVHPGIAKTSIIRGFAPFMKKIGNAFLYLFVHHSDKASLTEVVGLLDATPKGSRVYPRGLFQISGFPKVAPEKKRHGELRQALIGYLEELNLQA